MFRITDDPSYLESYLSHLNLCLTIFLLLMTSNKIPDISVMEPTAFAIIEIGLIDATLIDTYLSSPPKIQVLMLE